MAAKVVVILLTVWLLGVSVVRAAEGPPTCPAIGIAGGRTVYRCVDTEHDKIIYTNDLGFMFALEW